MELKDLEKEIENIIGFTLSTLSLKYVRKIWEKISKRNNRGLKL